MKLCIVRLTFFSHDTGVLILTIANYDLLPKNTAISMASNGYFKSRNAKELPALHAFFSADNTGRFARVCNARWFKIFLEAEDDIIEALRMLSHDSSN